MFLSIIRNRRIKKSSILDFKNINHLCPQKINKTSNQSDLNKDLHGCGHICNIVGWKNVYEQLQKIVRIFKSIINDCFYCKIGADSSSNKYVCRNMLVQACQARNMIGARRTFPHVKASAVQVLLDSCSVVHN